MSTPRLIVGLGNPGKDYEHTRHNLGFMVVRHLAAECKLGFKNSFILHGLLAHGLIEKESVYLFLPSTYMNNSGVAVKEIVKKKGISLEDALVVCDDLNLGFGELRLRASGSDGGHNGLSSLIAHLKTNKFARLRLGIGQSPSKEETVNFVLSEFNKKEQSELGVFIKEALDCCITWITKGTAKAMSQFNKNK